VGLAAAYAVAAFSVEPHLGRAAQPVLGAGAWLFLLAAVRGLESADRARIAALVLVATVGEVVFCLWLGLFRYRWQNLPSYVPPGHGLIFLAGLRLSRSPAIRRRASAVTGAALLAAFVWCALGLILDSPPDELGVVGLGVLAFFLTRGRRPLLYACVFCVAGPLELYATSIGTWHWVSPSPLLHLTSANPPSAIPAGYILFDALALRLLAAAQAAPFARVRRSRGNPSQPPHARGRAAPRILTRSALG
jgi:hypothetical protein